MSEAYVRSCPVAPNGMHYMCDEGGSYMDACIKRLNDAARLNIAEGIKYSIVDVKKVGYTTFEVVAKAYVTETKWQGFFKVVLKNDGTGWSVSKVIGWQD